LPQPLPIADFPLSFGNLTLGRFFTKHIGCYALSNRALAVICLVKVLSPKGERRMLASSPPLERKISYIISHQRRKINYSLLEKNIYKIIHLLSR